MRGGVTLAEIHEQPAVLSRLLEKEARGITALGAHLQRHPPAAVMLAARGSSDNAALYGRYLIETRLRIPAALAAPSVVTVYGTTPRLRRMLVIGLSQSGRSPDIVAYVEAANAAGARTIGITNDAASPLARAANVTLLLHAGRERGIAATKTYTAQLCLLSLLVAALEGDRSFADRHRALPDLVAEALRTEPRIRAIATRYRGMVRCIVTSRGYNFATAREAALKLKETGYIAAEALSSADLLHGPIALVGRRFPVILIAPPGPMRTPLASIARRLTSQGARMIVVSPDARMLNAADEPVAVPAVEDALSPHVYVVPLQLLSLHLALARGLDPDHPRGLRKVTRVL